MTAAAGRSASQGGYETVAPYYDLFAQVAGDSALPRVSFFSQLAKPGQRILDVGAGTGRVAISVAAQAEHVYCLEPSAAMRAALLAKVLHHGLTGTVTVMAGAAPDFRIPARFDYVYLAGVMQYLVPAQRPALFRNVTEHLRPGGVVAMDMIGGNSGSGWPLCELSRAVVGRAEYRLLCAATPEGRLRLRSFVNYQTLLGDRVVREEHVERLRHFHPTGDTMADLESSGLEVTGGSALAEGIPVQVDGGTLVAVLGDGQGAVRVDSASQPGSS